MNLVFEKELSIVKELYSSFIIKENSDGLKYLKGILDIPNEGGEVVQSFSIEIYPTEKFPFRFPKLFEIGGDIPCEADWHKYKDNSCCLTVEPDEILKCKNGITIVRFIKEIVIPYFANQIYRKHNGVYLNEYSHGINGFREFYNSLFKTNDIKLWWLCLEYVYGKRQHERNKLCYCGSNKKYKKCHLKVEEQVREIGADKVLEQFKMIIS